VTVVDEFFRAVDLRRQIARADRFADAIAALVVPAGPGIGAGAAYVATFTGSAAVITMSSDG